MLVLIKNNLKIMFRDKILIVILVILPVIVIAVLSSVFSDVLKKNYSMEAFKVGYYVQPDSKVEAIMPKVIQGFKDNNIKLEEMKVQEGVRKVKSKAIEAFVEINDNKYTIYKRNEESSGSEILENSVGSVMYVYDGSKMLMGHLLEDSNNLLSVQKIKADPMPSSTVYYGIVEVVYLICFGMIGVTALINSERKYGVINRIKLTNASPVVLFLGKLIPSVIAMSVEVSIAVLASTVLMGVDWGNSLLTSAGIIFLEIMSVSAFGILISTIIKNQALINVIIFLLSFSLGFLGGSFQTYMYNIISYDLVKLSPIYYINRSLVELSTKGSSAYIGSCIEILAAIFIVSSTLEILFISRRGRA